MRKITTLLSLFVCTLVLSNNDKYRIILNDDPGTTITIAWNQIDGTSPLVHYGTQDFGTVYASYPNSQGPDRSQTSKGMENQFVRLTGLTPDTAYYFVIHDSNSTSSRFWFKTAPDDRSRLSFLAGGDSRNNWDVRRDANLMVTKLKPHAIFFGGDMTSGNSSSEWQQWFDDWQDTTDASDGRMFPIIATRGNHETEATVIYDLFDTPDSNSYYGVTFGDDFFRIVTLNTELAPSGTQQTWLENDIAANPDVLWRSAQYHKPMRPHTASKAEGIDRYNAWAQIFYDEGFRVVFESDSHTVKTTWPVEPSSGAGSSEGFIRNDDNGTVYAGEGCWGAPTRAADDDKPWTRNSGQMNQFKMVWVSETEIEMRTIIVDNVDVVAEVSNEDPFTLPNNLDVWSPSEGPVVIIYPPGTSPIIEFASGTPANYISGTDVNIDVSVLEEAAGITKVEFYVDDVLTFTDDIAPYGFTNTYANGNFDIKAIATDLNAKTDIINMNIYVGSFSDSDSVQISTGNDDVEENGNDNSVYFDSSDLELTYDNSGTGNQIIGLRFLDLNIPAGATVTSARIQFTADSSHSTSITLEIYAEDSGSAVAFEDNATNRVSARSKVGGSVSWNPASWTNGSSGNNERTPQINSLLQQVIDRCDWASGNDVVFIIEGNTGTDKRRADSYNVDGGSNAPVLEFSYTFDAAVSNGNDLEIAYDENDPNDYNNGTNIALNVDALENGYGITKVEFYIDGVLDSTDTTSPYSFTNTYANGSYEIEAIATDACNTHSVLKFINVGNTSGTYSTKIKDGNDDIEETETGRVYFDSSDLEMVYDAHTEFGVANGYQTIGLRFQDINIPYGATISNAYIQFRSDEVNTDSASFLVYAEDHGNAVAFADDLKQNATGRDRVSGSVSWNPAGWASAGLTGTDQQTPDLSSLLQQIVDRCDWEQGNTALFVMEGTGVSLSSTTAKRVGDSFEGSSSAPPTLVYTFSYNTNLNNTNKTEYSGSSWNNGTPNSDSFVVIKSNYDTSIDGDIDACTLTVKEGITLTVGAGSLLKLGGDITVEGTLIVKHEGIVVQVEEDAKVTNNGTIKVELTTPFLKPRDFMIMGSPMTEDSRNGVFTNAFLVLDHTAANFIPHSGVPAGGTNFADDNGDFWNQYNTTIDVGRGYLVRPQDSYSSGNMTYDMTYQEGTLNNGDVSRTIVYNGAGPNPDGTPNVLANPYASPISAYSLIDDNSIINEVYFWEHLTTPSPSIPGAGSMNFSMDDVSMYNLSGGVKAANDPGSSTEPNGVISTGQGFAIKSFAAGSMTFTNSMRLTSGNNTLRNPIQESSIDRIWLSVTNSEFELASTTMVAFNPEATANIDAGFDSNRLSTILSLYTQLEDGSEQLGIQTREAFDSGIKVLMGFASQVDAHLSYTISIDNMEGLNISQTNVYLYDSYENVITNLSDTNYSFSAEIGNFEGRFTLQFENDVVLETPEVELSQFSVYPNPTDGILNISSPNSLINGIKIYDIQGRIVNKINIESQNTYRLDISTFDTAMYFVEINTESGIITKRIIKE